MKKTALLLISLLPFLVLGQNGINYKYDWEETPTVYVPTAEESTEDALIVFEKRHDEYIRRGATVTRCELIHIRKALLTDKGIEKHNKFYISTSRSFKVVKLKARVIQPSGKIILLNEDNIIESKDEEGNVQYRYFVFEGIEKGSTIEYLHYVVYRFPADIGGIKSDYQSIDISGPIKKKSVEATVTVGRNLLLSSYTTNGLPAMTEWQEKKQQTYSLVLENVDKAPDEEYGFDAKAVKRLYYNVAAPQSIYLVYESVADKVYGFMYYEMQSAKDQYQDKLDAFIDTVITTSNGDDLSKLRAIENHIKTNMIYDSEASMIMERMLTTKRFNQSGSVKLMAYAAQALGIEAEIVLTCDRMEQTFPEKFESELFLETFMVWFPDLGVFYLPQQASRIGPAPKEFITNHGLFVSEKNTKKPLYYGDHAFYEIRTISQPSVIYTTDVIEAEVNIDLPTLNAAIDVDRSVTGYFADSYQSNISYLNDEELHEVKEEYLQYLLPASSTLDSMWFENDHSNDFNSKPFVGHGTATSSTLVTEAGNKLLVNVGTLIGAQADLYQEKPEERQLPVDFVYTRQYERTIRVNIPEGYTVTNLRDFGQAPETTQNLTPVPASDSLVVGSDTLSVDEDENLESLEKLEHRIDPKLFQDAGSERGRPSTGFISRATIVNDQVVITVSEWYDEISYPKEFYFRVVESMNAAADFNALVLVLEKE